MAIAAAFFADGFEEVEAFTPVDYLRRAGVNVITVAVKGKPVTIDGEKKILVTGSHNIQFIPDISLENYLNEFSENTPDLIFCPGGGKGAENLSNTEILLKHIEKAFSQERLISAICASPAVVLGKTNIMKGKKWTCYPDMEGNAKPEYLNGHEDKPFVTDGNIITGRAAGASEQFAMELIRLIAGKQIAAKIKNGTCQR